MCRSKLNEAAYRVIVVHFYDRSSLLIPIVKKIMFEKDLYLVVKIKIKWSILFIKFVRGVCVVYEIIKNEAFSYDFYCV